MKQVKIEYRTIRPLGPDDEFDASGDFDQDAHSLGAIYGIADVARLRRDLEAFYPPRKITPQGLMNNLLEVHPDLPHPRVSRFMFDCRRSIVANIELWR